MFLVHRYHILCFSYHCFCCCCCCSHHHHCQPYCRSHHCYHHTFCTVAAILVGITVADKAKKYSDFRSINTYTITLIDGLPIKMVNCNNFHRHAYLITSGATPVYMYVCMYRYKRRGHYFLKCIT